MVLYIRLGAKIGDLHAKDSNSFCNRLMAAMQTRPTNQSVGFYTTTPLKDKPEISLSIIFPSPRNI